jgi:hypothetical protein
MRIIKENKPCIYLETKDCGKKIEFFDYSENLLLTKKSGFEILITRKMNDMRIDKKFHPLIINSLEVLLPIVVLLIAGLLLAPRE